MNSNAPLRHKLTLPYHTDYRADPSVSNSTMAMGTLGPFGLSKIGTDHAKKVK